MLRKTLETIAHKITVPDWQMRQRSLQESSAIRLRFNATSVVSGLPYNILN